MRKTLLALTPLLLTLMLFMGMSSGAQDTPTLTIGSPTNGATVDPAGFTVSGTGANLFEGNVVVRALDANGTTLAQQATVLADGSWSVSLAVNATPGSAGSIFAFSLDGENNVSAQSTVSVIYGQAEPTEEPTEEPTPEITASITITQPQANSVIPAVGTFLVEGSATAVHEGIVNVRVLDTGGNVLAQGVATAEGAALGGTGSWTLTLSINTTAGTSGSIYAYSTSPDDGSTVAEASIPVTFGPDIVLDDFAVNITSPGVGAVITTASFVVSGTSLNAPNNRVQIQARDANNRPIVTGTVQANEAGAWSGTLVVNFTEDVNGNITAFFNDPETGTTLASQSVNVTFRKNCNIREEWQHIYTVQRGDTLSRIAAATGTTYTELAQANCLNTVNTILVGQQLRVPRAVAVSTGTQEPVDSGLSITIEVPGAESVLDVTTPVEVSGTATGLSETEIIVLALDNTGRILTHEETRIGTTAPGTEATWSVSLDGIETSTGTQGIIFAYATSPEDGRIEVADAVNVVYGQSATPAFVNISEPLPFTVLENDTFTVSGRGGGLFEGNVVVEVKNESGDVLSQRPTILDAREVGGTGNWSIDLAVDIPAGTRGTITAYSTSPQDGSVTTTFSIPVRFGAVDTAERSVEIITPLIGTTFTHDVQETTAGTTPSESDGLSIEVSGIATGNNNAPVIVQIVNPSGNPIATQAVVPIEGNLWTTSFVFNTTISGDLRIRAFFTDQNTGSVLASDRIHITVNP